MKPTTARITSLYSIDLPSPVSISLTLPYPTSVNRMYRYDRGRVHKSGEYKAWIKEAGFTWLMQKRKLPVKHINGQYVLEVLVYPPDSRMRDLGNLEKALSDFLQEMGIVRNDCLSKRITFTWADPPYTDYCVEVTISPYP